MAGDDSPIYVYIISDSNRLSLLRPRVVSIMPAIENWAQLLAIDIVRNEH